MKCIGRRNRTGRIRFRLGPPPAKLSACGARVSDWHQVVPDDWNGCYTAWELEPRVAATAATAAKGRTTSNVFRIYSVLPNNTKNSSSRRIG